MAVVEFPLADDFDANALAECAEFAALKKQGREEMYDSARIVQIWRKWIEETFGRIKALRHRSDGDDPPTLN
jgi:hypothetical protein